MKTLILFMAFGSGAEPDFSAFAEPKPAQKTELRLVNGVIYSVPVGTPWEETALRGKPFQTAAPSPTITQPFCPDGRCPLPGR